MPSVRKVAEAVSQKEGVSLNQFINLAVAEKVTHLQHDEWLARRPKASTSSIAKALKTLDRPTQYTANEEDIISRGLISKRRVATAKPQSAQSAPQTKQKK